MENIIYSDSLVEITDGFILFKKYFFPTLASKKVNFTDVNFIEIVEPKLFTGKYRIWGTTNFNIWFPLDTKRNKRDAIFILHRKGKSKLIGFTVEDPGKVKSILYEKGLLKEKS